MYSRLRSTAGDRDRTGTVVKDRRILSPVRLPIPPFRQRVNPIETSSKWLLRSRQWLYYHSHKLMSTIFLKFFRNLPLA